MHSILTQALNGTLTQETILREGTKLMNEANARVATKAERLRSLTAEQRAAMSREELHAYING